MKLLTIPQTISTTKIPTVSELFQMGADAMSSSSTQVRNSFNGRNMKRFFKNSPFLPLGIIALVIVFILVVVVKSVIGGNKNTTVLSASNSKKASVEKPRATDTLNKTFTFSLKDELGKEVSKIKYTIENVQLQNEIIVKGERARAIEGREFLIINLKITNDFNRSVQINSRDYIRLIVNKSSEKLAPDIHNDPVEVQAISTKYTRVGFPINDTDKNLTLQIGELNGPKESITLKLK